MIFEFETMTTSYTSPASKEHPIFIFRAEIAKFNCDLVGRNLAHKTHSPHKHPVTAQLLRPGLTDLVHLPLHVLRLLQRHTRERK